MDSKVRSRKTVLVVCAGVEALRFEVGPRVGLMITTQAIRQNPAITDML